MQIEKTAIKDLYILNNEVHTDDRGYFIELFNSSKITNFYSKFNHIQENLSYNKKKYTVRGMHYQFPPYSQSKIIYCLKGKILDTVVDLRKGSPTYLKHFSIELSEQNNKGLIVPHNFAHGFITLEDDSIVMYKVNNLYNPEYAHSIHYLDPTLSIK